MTTEIMIGFSWLSIMIIIGAFLRYKVRVFQNMLIPSSAIGGIIGFIFINLGVINISAELLQSFVTELFILSFISIGLTGNNDNGSNDLNNKSRSKMITKGVIWFAVAWGLFVNLQALVGMLTIKGMNIFGVVMDPMYGLLLPFGFSMGTGQAITYGTMAESEFGFQGAASLAITFAVVGYALATFVGIPLARFGIKKGLAKYSEDFTKDMLKGVMPKDSNNQLGKFTFHSSNIETLAFHIAMIGVVYLFAYYTMNLIASILPENIASFILGSLFIFGVLWGLIFSFTTKKMKLTHLFSTDIQKSITGWTIDFMIVASFMSVSLELIGEFIIPLIIITIIGGLVTTVVCFLIGQRMGSHYDFERTISFYGLVTGQVPNSLLLLRIVDPRFTTPPALEIAIYNSILPIALGQIFLGIAPIIWGWTEGTAMLFFAGFIVVYMVLLKVFGFLGPKTFTLFNRSNNEIKSEHRDVK